MKKVVKKMKNEKVARGRIVDPRGLVIDIHGSVTNRLMD